MPAYHDTGFVHRTPAWHGLSIVKQERPRDWKQAAEWGGITWEPEEKELFRISATRTSADDIELAHGGFMVPVTESKAIVRNDTGEELGVVGKGFKPVLNSQMGELIEAFIGADGSATYETAGSAMGGKIVYATVVLDEPFRIFGDESDTFTMAVILNGHDGNMATKVLPSNLRVLCANTAQMASALGDRTGCQVILRHTASITERLEQAKGALANMRAEGLKYREVCNQLAKVQMTSDQMDEALVEFVGTPKAGTASPTVMDNAAQAASTIKGYLTSKSTSEFHQSTAYGLFQAMTEYLDHGREYKSQDTYVRRSLLTMDKGKTKALRVVTKTAGISLALGA